MATLTCARSDLFTVGATVTVHPFGSRQEGGPPGAASVASGTVDSNGLLSITDSDIASYTAFWLYSLVGTEHRYCLARSTLDVQDSGGAIGTGNTTAASADIASASAASGEFRIGQRISGPGIAPGSSITGIASTTLTLNRAATATASGVALVAEGAFTWQARVRRRRAALGTA